MFERIVVLDGSERAERVIPVVASVEISEKDLADAASYLAALQTAYAKRKVKSQAYPDEAMAFGLHLLKLEPKVVRVGVYDRPTETLSPEKPLVIITRDDLPRSRQPADRDQQPSGLPPRWARVLVRLILGSSFR